MVTTDVDFDDIEVSEPEGLVGARSWLQYVRRSSVADARFTLSARIELVYGHTGRVIASDTDLVQYALDFANGDTDHSRTRQALESGKQGINGDGMPLSPSDALKAHEKVVKQVASRRRAFLSRMISGDWLPELDKTQSQLQRIWLLPEIKRTSSGATLRHHVIILDSKGFDAYVDLLLLDDERGIGSDLCQCKLATCSRFFIAQKPATGRPQRLYCRSEHMLEAHRLNSTKRAQRSRAKKSARRRK